MSSSICSRNLSLWWFIQDMNTHTRDGAFFFSPFPVLYISVTQKEAVRWRNDGYNLNIDQAATKTFPQQKKKLHPFSSSSSSSSFAPFAPPWLGFGRPQLGKAERTGVGWRIGPISFVAPNIHTEWERRNPLLLLICRHKQIQRERNKKGRGV
jgi:hypothetical protein